jgi:hypothetical protein
VTERRSALAPNGNVTKCVIISISETGTDSALMTKGRSCAAWKPCRKKQLTPWQTQYGRCYAGPIKAGGISIEVRDHKGQVMSVRFSIEIEVGRKN